MAPAPASKGEACIGIKGEREHLHFAILDTGMAWMGMERAYFVIWIWCA